MYKLKASEIFFSVERERLFRKDGVDTKHDAIYKKATKEQLAVVSRDYALVTHRQAVDFANHTLKEAGVTNTVSKYELSKNGAKLFNIIQFPDYKFDVAKETGIVNTADGSKHKDVYMPQMIVRNSYDKSSSLDFIYGAFRFVCSNGMLIGDTAYNVKVKHSGKHIDFAEYKEPLIERIVATIEGVKKLYVKLNTEDGEPYIKLLILENFFNAVKYRKLLIGQLSNAVEVDYETNEKGKLEPVNVEVTKEISAYAVYSILTAIITHKIKSPVVRQRLGLKTAQIFKA